MIIDKSKYPKIIMKKCEAKGCEERMLRAAYCNKHRLRFKRSGDPLYRSKVYKGEWKGVPCRVDNCPNEAKIKGICNLHYQRDYKLMRKGLPRKHLIEE